MPMYCCLLAYDVTTSAKINLNKYILKMQKENEGPVKRRKLTHMKRIKNVML